MKKIFLMMMLVSVLVACKPTPPSPAPATESKGLTGYEAIFAQRGYTEIGFERMAGKPDVYYVIDQTGKITTYPCSFCGSVQKIQVIKGADGNLRSSRDTAVSEDIAAFLHAALK